MSEPNIYAVALVYSRKETYQSVTFKLLHWGGECLNANEALGKAIAAFRSETDGYGLQMSSVMPFFDDDNHAPEE